MILKKNESFFYKHKDILAYLFWGILTTVVSWLTYTLFVKILPLESSAVAVANILSWICAVLFAFITNKLWVFHSEDWALNTTLSELGKFVAARLSTGIIEIVGVPLLVAIGLNQTIFGIEGMLSKVLVSIIVVILNYVASKFFVFKPPQLPE